MNRSQRAMWASRAAIAIAATTTAPAHAADAPAPASLELEEVTVTATKRAESLQSVPVSVTALTAGVLEIALTNSVIDVAIGGPIQESEDIVQVAEHGFTDRYAVLSAVDHPLQGRGELSIQDVAAEPWVMPPAGAVPRRQFNDLTSRLGIAPPHIAVETRSPAVIEAMVAKSSCLGWLPEPLFAAEQAAGFVKALPVREMAMPRRFFVFRRRRNCTPPPVVRFLEALRSVMV
jgi:DNA-binding transcriptional LysR family regulator